MSTEMTAINPFSAGNKPEGGALIETESQRAIQEVQAAMVIAKRFPRDPQVAVDRILQACTRPSLVDSALYSYNRGGAAVTGPSIRLAETMAQCWGNIQFGVRELSQSNGESTVEAFAWDVETNTRQVKVFQVPHVRHSSYGQKKLTDPRDIYEAVANQGARRLRACILGVIPSDVTEEAVKQCEATMAAAATASPESVANMLKAFADFGVTPQMIQKRLECNPDAIHPTQMVQLKKIYASLRDGMSDVSQWFEADSVNDLRERSQRRQATDDSTQQQNAAPAPQDEQAAAANEELTPPPADDMFPGGEQAAPAEPVRRQRRQREIE